MYKHSATSHQTRQAKSKKPKPEPKSPSPATSSGDIAESKEPKSPRETPAAKVLQLSPEDNRVCPVKRARNLTVSQSSPPPKEDFESYYLKRVTAEFADDIDKLRNAPDFGEQSAPVLIQALKRGAKGFSEEEREKMMNGSRSEVASVDVKRDWFLHNVC